jgi:bacteriorhodopsin
MLQIIIENSFNLVFIAFVATALFLFAERDNVPYQFRTVMSVSFAYISIAALNYYFMREIYADSLADGAGKFPTHFRYIDWLLTTPLMLLKFPLMLGLGEKGRTFMIRLVCLDLVMIITGYIGELNPESALIHNGLFMIGCGAWLLILWLMFNALSTLPDYVPQSVRDGVKAMGFFMFVGWAIYPAGYMAPLLGVPPDVRELVYNIADVLNKVGLCLLVYITAKRAGAEMAQAEAEQAENATA